MPQQTIQRETSSSARIAVIYLTVGALLMVWSLIWALYLITHQPVKDITWFWDLGFFLSGLTLVGIGMSVGPLGRTARQADAGENPAIANPPVATAVPTQPTPAQNGQGQPNQPPQAPAATA